MKVIYFIKNNCKDMSICSELYLMSNSIAGEGVFLTLEIFQLIKEK